MIGNDNTWIVRGCVGSSVLALLMAAATCAAPDAQPSDEPVVEPPSDASDTSDASDATDAPDAPDKPNEPPAGIPVWGLGYGSASDQRVFDVALASPTDFVTTIGFGGSIAIMGPGMFNATSVRNILVAGFAVDKGTGRWATAITANGEIVRSVVDVDVDGNTLVAGGFNNTLTIGNLQSMLPASNFDAYIAKFDSMGKPLWIRSFGEAKYEFITDLATDQAGNIVVVGVTEGAAYKFGTTIDKIDVVPPPVSIVPDHDDIFVAKFDRDGNAIWAKRLGHASGFKATEGTGSWLDPSATVAVSHVDGSIVVGGSFSQTIMFAADQVKPNGKEDGFVTKLDPDGNSLWHITFGDDSRVQRVRSVAYTSTGDVFFTGSFQGVIELGNTTLTSYKDSENLLVAKVDSKGMPLWARGYGHIGRQIGTKILVDAKDQPVVFGSFVGAIDLFNEGGTILDTNPGTKTDLFVAKFSSSGMPFWGRAYGDLNPTMPENQEVDSAVLCKDGDKDRAIVVGMNRGTLEPGGMVAPMLSLGAEDAFMMSITY